MSNFERVLSDDELWAAAVEVEWQGTIGQYRLIEQAVLAKLAAQEPVMYARTYYGEIDWDEACVTEKNDGALMHATDMRKEDFVRHGYAVIPLYAHPMPSLQQDPEATDTYSMCAVADSNYAAGMLQGWNLCVADDEEKFLIIRENRMRAAAQASRASKSQEAASENQTEQEPVAWRVWIKDLQTWSYSSKYHGCGEPLYTYPMTCVSPTSDKTACVSEIAESETQTNSQGFLDSSNHVVGNNEMVADMYWINPDYPSYTSILDAFDPVQSAVDVEIGDQFEVSRAKTLPDLTIEVTELEENGDVKDYKILNGDHIPDIGQMVTPLAQRKIQTLLDKGEYRVIENANVLVNENGHAAIVNRGGAFYWVDNEGLAREFDAAGVESAGENT